jgi:hypothetical protein
MQASADAGGSVSFEPEWCVFWAHYVRSSQFAIWQPYLRRSRFRFGIMATANEVPASVRDEVGRLANCLILEPYAEVLDRLAESHEFRGFIYVGSNMDNAALMDAFPDAAHVWVGHGESAKKANRHRTASAYDSVFVADYAAVQRYPRAIRPWVLEGACAIGTPIVEGLRADPWDRPRPVRALLYAPTWEGFVAGADYSSVAEVGPALLEAMPALAERETTVLLRPHPGTGIRLPELRDLIEQLEAAGAVRGRVKGEQLMRADVIVSDVSGVTSEYLFTRRPAILPVTPRVRKLMRGEVGIRAEYPWVYQWDVRSEGLVDRIEALERNDPLASAREVAARRFFRDHRTLEDAVRSFDLALSAAHSRHERGSIQRAYERSRADALADTGPEPRVSSDGGDRVEGLPDRVDGTAPEGGGVDGISRGDG